MSEQNVLTSDEDRKALRELPAAVVPGTPGDDFLVGTEEDDVLEGGDGQDFLQGLGGSDQLIGGNGDDILEGGAGTDVLDGGDGFDLVEYARAPAAVVVNLAAGMASGGEGDDTLAGIEGVLGSTFDDQLVGNDGDNLLRGRGGNDHLDGGAGRDVADYSDATGPVSVNLANGMSSGADGNDTLVNIEDIRGSDHNDSFTGNEQANTFQGGLGDDFIDGGAQPEGGFDIADYSRASGSVTVNLAEGQASGADGNDSLLNIEGIIGSSFDDHLIGSGADLEYFRGGQGNDIIEGGEGTDVLDYLDATSGVTITLTEPGTGTATGNDSGNDSFTGIEHLYGSNFDDAITGSEADEGFRGRGGNDVIDGGGGTDTAYYEGERANFTITKEGQGWRITDTTGAEGTDELVNFEKLVFADQQVDLVAPPSNTPPEYNTDAGFLFDPVHYLLANPELAGTVTQENALEHYLQTGAAQGLQPNSWFDAEYYANRWDDLRGAGLDDATLFMHYNLYGVWEGRAAGPAFEQFDGPRYLADNPDVAAYVHEHMEDTPGAIAHFVLYGLDEQRTAYDLVGQPIDLDYTV